MTVKGTIYIISAPSGAGKSSLINAIIKDKLIYKTYVSVSYTTRTIRSGEINGNHYFFISVTEFENLINKNYFLEYAKVFGNYYGTANCTIKYKLSQGFDIFLDIDWQGAKQVRKKILDTCSIFILPPSKEELDRRLLIRGQDNKISINTRMKKAVKEISHFLEYDYLIINDDFNLAVIDLKMIINSQKLKIIFQKNNHSVLINNLLSK